MFLHLFVSHSVYRGGGCLPHCMLGYPPPPPGRGRHPPQDQRQIPPHHREADPPGPEADIPPPRTRCSPPPKSRPPNPEVDPPPQCMLGDTGKKRAVRILLECILVQFILRKIYWTLDQIYKSSVSMLLHVINSIIKCSESLTIVALGRENLHPGVSDRARGGVPMMHWTSLYRVPRTPCPASDIWWSSLETCSNLLILGTPQ